MINSPKGGGCYSWTRWWLCDVLQTPPEALLTGVGLLTGNERRTSLTEFHDTNTPPARTRATADPERRRSNMFGMAAEIETAAETNMAATVYDVGELMEDACKSLGDNILRGVLGVAACTTSTDGGAARYPIEGWQKMLGDGIIEEVLLDPRPPQVTPDDLRCCPQRCLERVEQNDSGWLSRMRETLEEAKHEGERTRKASPGVGLGSGRRTSGELLRALDDCISEHSGHGGMCTTSLLKVVKGYASNTLMYTRGVKKPPSYKPLELAATLAHACCPKRCLSKLSEVGVRAFRTRYASSWEEQNNVLWDLLHDRQCCNEACSVVVGLQRINPQRVHKIRNVGEKEEMHTHGLTDVRPANFNTLMLEAVRVFIDLHTRLHPESRSRYIIPVDGMAAMGLRGLWAEFQTDDAQTAALALSSLAVHALATCNR